MEHSVRELSQRLLGGRNEGEAEGGGQKYEKHITKLFVIIDIIRQFNAVDFAPNNFTSAQQISLLNAFRFAPI